MSWPNVVELRERGIAAGWRERGTAIPQARRHVKAGGGGGGGGGEGAGDGVGRSRAGDAARGGGRGGRSGI